MSGGRGWAGLVEQTGHSGIRTFRKVVSTAGNPEQIASTVTPCRMVLINASLGNSSPAAVGDANVVAANATMRGTPLIPGSEPVPIYIDDLSKLYVDVQTNGDVVCGTYYV